MKMTDNEKKEKLLEIVRSAVQQDQALREQYQIGDKFRFIREKLHALLAQVEENLTEMQATLSEQVITPQLDETIIYVYLYNAQGLSMETWKKMVQPSVLYEYSVNRPIYADLNALQSFMRSRHNKAQHAYLAMIINKKDVLPGAEGILKDAMGNNLIRVREGSLQFNKLISFIHNGHEFRVTEEGVWIKKEK